MPMTKGVARGSSRKLHQPGTLKETARGGVSVADVRRRGEALPEDVPTGWAGRRRMKTDGEGVHLPMK